MSKLLTTTAIGLLLSAGTAFALDDASNQPAEQTDQQQMNQNQQPQAGNQAAEAQSGDADIEGQPPTASIVSPQAAKEAKIPDEGEPDTSGGAMERSSAPPQSGAVKGADAGGDAASEDDMSGQKSSSIDDPKSDTSQE
jgi:hypothetical protein